MLFAKIMGVATAKCSHVPILSPVQIAPYLCEPAKNARERTKGRRGGSCRAISAWAVALCYSEYSVLSFPSRKLRIRAHEKDTVDIVYVTMLPASVMDGVLWSSDLRAVEDSRLVHVVPNPEVRSRAL